LELLRFFLKQVGGEVAFASVGQNNDNQLS
jgi:beta-lactamase superfamily II metal-dependent hydrolase